MGLISDSKSRIYIWDDLHSRVHEWTMDKKQRTKTRRTVLPGTWPRGVSLFFFLLPSFHPPASFKLDFCSDPCWTRRNDILSIVKSKTACSYASHWPCSDAFCSPFRVSKPAVSAARPGKASTASCLVIQPVQLASPTSLFFCRSLALSIIDYFLNVLAYSRISVFTCSLPPTGR